MVKRLWQILVILFVFCVFTTVSVQAAEKAEFPYEIKEGTIYYESSWGFGSGRYGIVEESNKYTDVPCSARIWLYSFLDEKGQVISTGSVKEGADIDTITWPENAVALWFNFWGPVYWNGWVDSKNVIPVDANYKNTQSEKQGTVKVEEILSKLPKEESTKKTPEEVVQQIEAITENFKTAIVVDDSSSMSDNQRQVIKKLESLDFTEDTVIVVFADSYKQVSYDELMAKKYNIGGATNLYGAMNYAAQQDVQTIILISDLNDNHGNELNGNSNIKNLIIYNPDDYRYTKNELDYIKKKWDATKIIAYTIK